MIFELPVPLIVDKPPLTANQRLHWAEKARRTRKVRESVCWRARQQMMTPQSYVIVQLHFRPNDKRRRDPANLVPTQKPAVDGLVDAGVIPDDTPEYVGELMPVIHEPTGWPASMWLAVSVRVLRPAPQLSAADRAWIAEDSKAERAQDAAEGAGS
jgi:crossover junction endodeoxyribonuclease RusA